MTVQDTVSIGTRFRLSSGHFGTIKYVGRVAGTEALWYGVEWDDPTRGRHDGVKDGTRYFDCCVPKAGSFIRPSAQLSFGRPFLTALAAKYIEAEHGAETLEKVILGSSNGAIEVEAVGLDKIRRNLGALDRLREVSLDSELVATANPVGEICSTCPNIRGLDLSSSLLTTWHDIASITAELPYLQRLALNRNRFLPVTRDLPSTAFARLSELQLNNTLISWTEFRNVTRFMTSLRSVELGHNRLTSLDTASSPSSAPPLQSLNFEGNQLADWSQTATSLPEYTALQRLVLSANNIRSIPPLRSTPSPLQGIKHLALSDNNLREWCHIDALHDWCPNLESLRITGNPLTEDDHHAAHARQFIVAKIPSLLNLGSAVISARERTDCELFYLSFISKHVSGGDNERAQEHPQWSALCNKHGPPDDSTIQSERDDKLSKHLIDVFVQQCYKPPVSLTDSGSVGALLSLKVLSTMKMSVFRLKLMKSLKLSHPRGREGIQVWLRLHDRYVMLDKDEQNLEWYGIENGTQLLVYTEGE